jgi:carboxypeptidase Taq
MTAAQLFEAAVASEPTMAQKIASGEFAPLLAWLGAHVHAKGSLLTPREVLIEATGRPLDAKSFERHLRRRYLAA